MHFSDEKKHELSMELFSIPGPSALTQMMGPHWESKDCDQRLRRTGQEKHEGHEEGGVSLFFLTGESRSGTTLSSRKDILIYKLRMFWSPTAEIDLVVHLIQLKSEFENNYDSRADRQLHFCSLALQFLLSVFPPHPFTLEIILGGRQWRHRTSE